MPIRGQQKEKILEVIQKNVEKKEIAVENATDEESSWDSAEKEGTVENATMESGSEEEKSDGAASSEEEEQTIVHVQDDTQESCSSSSSDDFASCDSDSSDEIQDTLPTDRRHSQMSNLAVSSQ